MKETGPTPEAEVGDPPATQPAAVSVPGTHNSEMGCATDWEPDCPSAQLALDTDDQIWKGTFTMPAGSYGYKAALDNSWSENYGARGVPRRREHLLRDHHRHRLVLLRPDHPLGDLGRRGRDRDHGR